MTDGGLSASRTMTVETAQLPVIDYGAFAPTGSDDEKTVIAAHELYTVLIGLWAPAIIEAAHDLGVYPQLSGAGVSSDQVADVLSLPGTASRILLDGLHACGIAERFRSDDGIVRYRLRERFAPLLLGGGAYHLLGKLSYDRSVAWSAWWRLPDSIRNGNPGPGESDGRNQNSEQDFVALVSGINFWAPHVVQQLRAGLAEDLGWDLSHPRSILDVGCGTGIYSQLLLRKQPEWTAVGIETPKVAHIAREQALRFAVADRFDCRETDFLEDGWDVSCDIVLLVNVVHLLPAATAAEFIERASRAVRPGGCLCVIDTILDDSKDTFDQPQDRFAAMFAVSMLATGGGDAHCVSDYRRWLHAAGLRPTAVRETPMHRVLIAVAP
ncbi:class I SAM-dependent methyltransferase [Nocardia transvalensis]|uniref:class I SAM-dependent methyltransferase n=1 Tax=Nocardia transvalensis TaxID=37333 RepID=UPI0018935592|nr:class I SAM-dependent methyltransferase [Nocardia transvalensis]MBF6330401.1 class I SAM-dependent methyltransferase [Nocardia transvalensis]